ncbi:unnamed protein product [Symbiodinium natans]|uniref:Uncharacterized protein n=1 Tax=Symbiodinium natans TaxID=878477 RepID=A0A812RSJ3_9DINO|nr:unnamed protein product [Symbiodinium natans]
MDSCSEACGTSKAYGLCQQDHANVAWPSWLQGPQLEPQRRIRGSDILPFALCLRIPLQRALSMLTELSRDSVNTHSGEAHFWAHPEDPTAPSCSSIRAISSVQAGSELKDSRSLDSIRCHWGQKRLPGNRLAPQSLAGTWVY